MIKQAPRHSGVWMTRSCSPAYKSLAKAWRSLVEPMKFTRSFSPKNRTGAISASMLPRMIWQKMKPRRCTMPLVCHWWLGVLMNCGSWPKIPPLGHLSHEISVADKDCDACNKKDGFNKIHGVFVSIDSAMIAWSLSLSVDWSLTDASARLDLRHGLEPTLCLVGLWKGVCTCPSRIQQARARLTMFANFARLTQITTGGTTTGQYPAIRVNMSLVVFLTRYNCTFCLSLHFRIHILFNSYTSM